eukprot:scaffold368_cov258-Pinguiococcus_pyrenoidosus.AAC.34
MKNCDPCGEENCQRYIGRACGSVRDSFTYVGAGPSVRHAQDSRSRVLELEVLVLEAIAVDRLASSAVMVGEVPPLAHEAGDHSVEGAALVAKACGAEQPSQSRAI